MSLIDVILFANIKESQGRKMEKIIQQEEVFNLFNELQSVGRYKVVDKVTKNNFPINGTLKNNEMYKED